MIFKFYNNFGWLILLFFFNRGINGSLDKLFYFYIVIGLVSLELEFKFKVIGYKSLYFVKGLLFYILILWIILFYSECSIFVFGLCDMKGDKGIVRLFGCLCGVLFCWG